MRPTKISSVFLATCLFLATLAAGPVVATDDPIVEGQLLIELSPGVSIGTILQRYDLNLIDSVPQWLLYQVEVNPPATVTNLLPMMLLDPDLDDVEPLKLLASPEGVQETIADLDLGLTPMDFVTQPATGQIQAGGTSLAFQTGTGVVVAVLDTSFDLDNPLLAPRLYGRGVDLIDGFADAGFRVNGVDDDGDGLIDEAAHHGSYVAGLILLVAPDARILPIRVLDEDGRGTSFDLAAGVIHAMGQYVDVINLSLVLEDESNIVRKAIKRAVARGITVVVPSGNRGLSLPEFPASMSEVISVGSVDAAGVRSSFGSYGEEIDVVAPGEGLISIFGDEEFAHWDGSSFAAPWVSGAAALILDRYPALRPQDVREALELTAQPVVDSPDGNGTFGSGMISAEILGTHLIDDWLTLKLDRSPGGSTVRWSRVPGLQQYALIRGDLSQVMPLGESISLGVVDCLSLTTLSEPIGTVEDTAVPAPGEGYFFVIGDLPSVEGYGESNDARSRVVLGGDCVP